MKNKQSARTADNGRLVDFVRKRGHEQLRFLTKQQLADRLNLPHWRCVDSLVAKKKIPILRLGYRTVRFDWPKVEEALSRLETRAIE